MLSKLYLPEVKASNTFHYKMTAMKLVFRERDIRTLDPEVQVKVAEPQEPTFNGSSRTFIESAYKAGDWKALISMGMGYMSRSTLYREIEINGNGNVHHKKINKPRSSTYPLAV